MRGFVYEEKGDYDFMRKPSRSNLSNWQVNVKRQTKEITCKESYVATVFWLADVA